MGSLRLSHEGPRISNGFVFATPSLLRRNEPNTGMVPPEGTFWAGRSYEGVNFLKDKHKDLGGLPKMLRKLRLERHVSMRVLADMAGVDASVVSRAERGQDARVSTWVNLFLSLGHRLEFDTMESSEEGPEIPAEESGLRRARRREGFIYRGRAQ